MEEWDQTVTDDAWGDAEDPWGDNKQASDMPKGKRSKEQKDKENDDLEGFEPADDWGDDDIKEDNNEEESEAPSKTPYRILDSKSLLKRRNKIIEENAEILGLSNEEMDLILRYLRYDKKKLISF